ncbi:MAG: ATP-binding protein [Bdellovibrionaceae bacterium]|nr:ATP-binding protein [Pseudobdellovibrionaceae bacterium]
MLWVGLLFVPLVYLNFFVSDSIQKLDSWVWPKGGGPPIILLDLSFVEKFGSEPHLGDWNRVLKNVLKHEPLAVVVTKPLVFWEHEVAEKPKPHGPITVPIPDKNAETEFLNILKSGCVFLAYDLLFSKGSPPSRLLPPFDQVDVVLLTPKTSDNVLFAEDGVTRRGFLTYQGQELGFLKLRQRLGLSSNSTPSIPSVRGLFELYDSEQIWLRFKPRSYFKLFRFQDWLEETGDGSELKGQVVFIGEDMGRKVKDYVKTPLEREPGVVTLTEYYAQVWENIINQDALIYLPKWTTHLVTFLVMLLTVYACIHLPPLLGLLNVFGVGALLVFLNWLLLRLGGRQIFLAHPLVGGVVTYYSLLPYRLYLERRQIWEVRREKELMRQVDELKSNFISMMSHDLRTPIARIQGMLEMFLRESKELSLKQREALDFIKISTEDLLRVLNAILTYAHIESQGIKLKKVSKDVNQILTEVIQKHQFLAKLKHIKIQFNQEALFPILVDPELMGQVFSNLLENAIKYSPEGSQVVITSGEREGYVVIEFQDEGMGIPEQEVPYLFTKFYRGKMAKSSSIKGTGLGLYLAKYFTELHGGSISVKSQVDVGSTFTVRLPDSNNS